MRLFKKKKKEEEEKEKKKGNAMEEMCVCWGHSSARLLVVGRSYQVSVTTFFNCLTFYFKYTLF